MIWLRASLYALGLLIATPVFSTLALLAYPLPPLTRSRIISGWARVMLWWAKLTCGLNYRVVGAENIPDHPCVILAKHQSAWETMAFQCVFPPVVWVMKRELLRIPFFGWGLAMTSPIAIDRSAGKEALKQVTEQGRARLEKGFWVVVFPEGTRVRPGIRGKYNIGGAFLATHSKATVLPVAHNAGEFWGKNAFLKYPGTITLSIGKPIQAEGMKTGELNSQVETWIEQEMVRISHDFESGPLAAPSRPR
ncbi:MAG: 1-acyl-sn-glycerol-3-phosphate acyltransferase [Sulfuricella denitrificans]|nr:1-acyl-sn-glycerol-3-phosphate acyltransferase [Sulfuricella denitrificans]